MAYVRRMAIPLVVIAAILAGCTGQKATAEPEPEQPTEASSPTVQPEPEGTPTSETVLRRNGKQYGHFERWTV